MNIHTSRCLLWSHPIWVVSICCFAWNCFLFKVSYSQFSLKLYNFFYNIISTQGPLTRLLQAVLVFDQDPGCYRTTLTHSDCADGCLLSIWSFESCLGSKRPPKTCYILSESCREYESLSRHCCVCSVDVSPLRVAVTNRSTWSKTYKKSV